LGDALGDAAGDALRKHFLTPCTYLYLLFF
jgi:hypothetical protein